MVRYPLENLAKYFLKHELNLNLSSVSPKPIKFSGIDSAVKKSLNYRKLNRNNSLVTNLFLLWVKWASKK